MQSISPVRLASLPDLRGKLKQAGLQPLLDYMAAEQTHIHTRHPKLIIKSSGRLNKSRAAKILGLTQSEFDSVLPELKIILQSEL